MPNNMKKELNRYLSETAWTPTDTQNVLKAIRRRKTRVRLPVLAAAVLGMALLAAFSVMAENRWGVLDWLLRPPEARPLPIQTAKPILIDDTGHAVAEIQPLEAVTDGYGLYLSAACVPKQPGTLLLNASLNPNTSPVSEIGVLSAPADMTIAEWAQNEGYSSLYSVLLYSSYFDALGTFDSRQAGRMSLREDGASVITLAGGYQGTDQAYALSYYIAPYARAVDGAWEEPHDGGVEPSAVLHFRVEDIKKLDAEEVAVYVPVGENPSEKLHVEKLTLLRSPLASYFAVCYTDEGTSRGGYTEALFGLTELPYPDVLIHGRQARQLPDGTQRALYFCTRELPAALPDRLTLDGVLPPDIFAEPEGEPVSETIEMIRVQ